MELPFAFEQIQVTNWAYLSSLLLLVVFFKFNRFWSVRNFDLVLIILIAPGVLLIARGSELSQVNNKPSRLSAPNDVVDGMPDLLSVKSEKPEPEMGVDSTSNRLTGGQRMVLWGYIWLFSISFAFFIRMLLDPIFKRKPLLNPNLTIGGLVFLVCSLLAFSIFNVIKARAIDVSGAKSAVKLMQREAAGDVDTQALRQHGPGYALFHLFPVMPTFPSGTDMMETDPDHNRNIVRYEAAAKSLALIGQIAIVFALIFIGNFLFQNFLVGVGMGAIYLMLPYTSVYAGHVLHVLPAALLVWAVACYRQPALAGVFLGFAIGVSYYPLFLLPLWISFYWEKGSKPFLIGVLFSVLCCVGGLVFTSRDPADFFNQLIYMFGFWWPLTDGLGGVWDLGWDPIFRLPILVAFVSLSVSFAFWPTRKNVGTLIAYTAAIMIGVQFWHGFGGGLYVAWYLPLVLATIFRPNLSERNAVSDLATGVLGIRKIRIDPSEETLNPV